MRLEGDVTISMLILEDGTVGEVRVLGSPASILANAAKNATKAWRFVPAKKDGVPVRTWLNETISYRLK